MDKQAKTSMTPLTDEELAEFAHAADCGLVSVIHVRRLIAEVRRLRKMVDVDRGAGAWRA